jgi:hypothetical protein
MEGSWCCCWGPYFLLVSLSEFGDHFNGLSLTLGLLEAKGGDIIRELLNDMGRGPDVFSFLLKSPVLDSDLCRPEWPGAGDNSQV